MGTKFRGVVLPSESPAIGKSFDSIKPVAPMQLIRVSQDVLGVRFSYMNPGEEEYNRIGCRLSHVAGIAAFYWCHSAIGEGYTLYEHGSVVERSHNETQLGALPFRGATYDDLVNAFCCRVVEPLSWNVPTLFDVVRQLDAEDFNPGMKNRKNAILKRAELIERTIDAGRKDEAIELLRGELLPCAQDWFRKRPTVLVATIRTLMDQLNLGQAEP